MNKAFGVALWGPVRRFGKTPRNRRFLYFCLILKGFVNVLIVV